MPLAIGVRPPVWLRPAGDWLTFWSDEAWHSRARPSERALRPTTHLCPRTSLPSRAHRRGPSICGRSISTSSPCWERQPSLRLAVCGTVLPLGIGSSRPFRSRCGVSSIKSTRSGCPAPLSDGPSFATPDDRYTSFRRLFEFEPGINRPDVRAQLGISPDAVMFPLRSISTLRSLERTRSVLSKPSPKPLVRGTSGQSS